MCESYNIGILSSLLTLKSSRAGASVVAPVSPEISFGVTLHTLCQVEAEESYLNIICMSEDGW